MNKPSSLYIHIPFCEHICDYCDFPKLQYFRFLAIKYLESLKKEIKSLNINHRLKTIYIGGGTPTELEDDLFIELLKIVSKYSEGVEEYTIETNPKSLTVQKLIMMKEYGVNRLSIGVESTNDEILALINRYHTFNDVKNAISRAKRIGFDNLNVDLILGLPHSSKKELEKDIKNILSLDVKHVSCYSLTVHPHTVFYLKGINEPLEEDVREYYDYIEEELKKNNYVHYEISNWAKAGYESKHNFTYWKNEQYYGVGLGASGYIDNIRYTNTKNLTLYNKGQYKEVEEVVTSNDKKIYQIILNLRTNKGIDLKRYKKEFDVDFYDEFKEILDEYLNRNLLIKDEKNIYPTYEGMMILDNLLVKLMAKI